MNDSNCWMLIVKLRWKHLHDRWSDFQKNLKSKTIFSLTSQQETDSLSDEVIYSVGWFLKPWSTETADADFNVLQRSVDYTCGVSNLLGTEYTVSANIVSLISVDYAAFNRRLQHARPKDRLTKGVFCRFGVIYPDVAFLPVSLKSQLHDTFSVEIKPKQGWKLDTNEKCRYCCLQYLKVFQILRVICSLN